MSKFLSIFFFSCFVQVVAQPVGIINESTGEVIVRSGRDIAFIIEGRIREGQKFRYWPEENQNWWYVESLDRTDKVFQGFVPRTRIQPFYPEFDPFCECQDAKDPKPVIQYSVGDRNVVICGGLLQKRSQNDIIIRHFTVKDCSGDTTIVSYGPTETCFAKVENGDLLIESVKKLPLGRHWVPTRIPVTQQKITYSNGNFIVTPRELVVRVMMPQLQVQLFLDELESKQGKGQVTGTNYKEIVDKLLTSALSGNENAQNLLRDADDFFGFDLSNKYERDYFPALALMEAWLKQ